MSGSGIADALSLAVRNVAAATGNALPAGWRLREFEIASTIGEGGFGIVYLARDLQLRRDVAIKEFMPSALAARRLATSMVVMSDRYRTAFDAGRRSFLNEARLLAQFDHPALVKVYQFWEENGTAYMVMPYYKGRTLSQWLKSQPARPSEQALLPLVDALLEPLEQLHSQNVFHRDIAPDNVLLLEDGRPLLLDFGSARRIIGDMTQALTVVLKPGYAPIEQYAEVRSMRQGPWTDLYALAALLYVAVTGRAPPPAVARMMNDDCVPAAELAAGCYSDRFLAAIDRGLMLWPQDRPATIGHFRDLLGLAAKRRVAAGAGKAAGAPARAASPMPRATTPRAEPAAAAQTPARSTPASRSPMLPILAAVMAALVVVVAGLTWRQTRSAVEQSVINSVAPEPPPRASDSTASPGDSRRVPQQPSPTQPMVLAKPRLPDPADLVRAVYDARTPSIAVQARTTASRLVIGRDQMRLFVASSRRGYLYVLIAGTQGELAVLVPNSGLREARLEPGRELHLPTVDATGPPGVDRLIFVVAERPLALDARPAEGLSLPRFDLGRLAVSDAATRAPRCSGVIPCDVAYGAAMLEIREVDR